MRHLARRHEITYLRSPTRRSRSAPRRRCARSQLAARDRAARRTRPRAASASTPASPASARPAALCGGAVPLDGVSPAADALLDARRLRSDRLRLPGAGGQPAAAAAVPVRALHAQRRSRDLAPARRDRKRRPMKRMLYRQQWRRMLHFEGTHAVALRSLLAVSDADEQTLPTALSGRDAGASRTLSPTGVDTSYFTPDARRRPSRRSTWCSSARWTGCRTTTRCCSSAARCCRASARRSPT